MKKGLSKEQWNEFKNLDLENPLEVKRFADRLVEPRLRDYLYEYWYNAILSGVPTHVVNIGSNTLWMAYQFPHRALTSIVDKTRNILTGSARTRYLNELLPMMGGVKTGAKRGVGAAKDVMTKGEITDFETKWAEEVGSALGAFERSPNPVVKKMGKYLTIPTKALRGMDVFGNSIAYDAEMGAIARRVSNVKNLRGDKRKLFEQKFIKSPPQWAHDEAKGFVQYATFMSEPGKFSKAIMQMRESFPGGRLLIPFVNTIGNLTKRGVEMVPGVGLSLARGQNVSEVIAKQIEGSILTFLTMNKIANGELTGSAPDTENERERFYAQGKQPWAIKIGDKWYQYRRIEPFNTVPASATIYYNKIVQADDDETKTKMFSNAVSEFKNNLIDSGYLQGISQALNRHGSLEGIVPRTVSSFVPYSGFWRSINRAYEAQVEGKARVRDTSGITSMWQLYRACPTGRVCRWCERRARGSACAC